jgi:hypothetical protein
MNSTVLGNETREPHLRRAEFCGPTQSFSRVRHLDGRPRNEGTRVEGPPPSRDGALLETYDLARKDGDTEIKAA